MLQLILLSNALNAQDASRFVAIVFDDLGNDLQIGQEVISLPYDITYSFLPHTKYSIQLITQAQNQHKEIMLHLPMQALNNKAMGPGGLSVSMTQEQFIKTLRGSIRAIPGAIGVNNHMGSLLTQQMIEMQWLMEELKENKNLYFLDSKTHALSVAAEQASAYRIPTASRDIFLDHVVEENEIDNQFQRLLSRVNSVGYALAIGHPHEETVQVLKNWLPKLRAEGIEIVPVSEYISLIESRSLLWQASLSRSHKVVKN